MLKTAQVRPVYSIIFILDPKSPVDVPNFEGGIIAYSETCIIVGTLAEMDGTTTVVLTDEDILEGNYMIFNGEIDTPSMNIAIENANSINIILCRVNSVKTRVAIYGNDLSEPDHIIIKIQSGENKIH